MTDPAAVLASPFTKAECDDLLRIMRNQDSIIGSRLVERLAATLDALAQQTARAEELVDWTARGVRHDDGCLAEHDDDGMFADLAAPMAERCDCGLRDSMLAGLPEDVQQAISARWAALQARPDKDVKEKP